MRRCTWCVVHALFMHAKMYKMLYWLIYKMRGSKWRHYDSLLYIECVGVNDWSKLFAIYRMRVNDVIMTSFAIYRMRRCKWRHDDSFAYCGIRRREIVSLLLIFHLCNGWVYDSFTFYGMREHIIACFITNLPLM